MKTFNSVKTIGFILYFSILFSSCGKFFKDDELSLTRVPYTGNELRIDGYYFYEHSDPARIDIYFLYRNGIILYGGTPLSSEIKETENKIQTDRWHEIIKNDITSWGVFHVNGSTIKFERWYPSSGGGAPSAVREGKILNDSTFHITVSYRSNGSERNEKDEIYHFREFAPKPDSTNNFIK